MAWFTVQYRDKNGEKAEAEFEAPDRNALFTILKEKNISAISVRAGHREVVRNNPIRTRVFVVLAVLLAVGLCWMVKSLFSEAPHQPPSKKVVVAKPTTEPRTVTKAEVRPSVPEQRPKTADDLRRERNESILKEARERARAQGLPWADAPRKTVAVERPPKIFKYNSEGHIAALLEVKPGMPIVGEFDFDDRFLEDMLNSFKEPIEISPDDDEYTRELKKQVQETKDELYQMFQRGEDVAAVIRETRKQLQNLGMAQMQIQSELHELLNNPEITAEELKDFENAANIILQEKLRI